jgi:hypothetical protein
MVEIGGIVSGMAGTLGKIVLMLVVAAAGFFGTKFLKKAKGKKKAYAITAVISNPDGSHYVDYIGKFKDKDNLDKMKFKLHKLDTCPVINPKYIVSRSIHLFRYGPGEFAIIPPTVYRQLDPKSFKIKLINMNMLAFKGMEQRAAISRWQTNKDKIEQWLPWITIVLCVGCALGAIYLSGQTSASLVKDGIAARTTECSELIPVETISDSIIDALAKNQYINPTIGVVSTPSVEIPV